MKRKITHKARVNAPSTGDPILPWIIGALLIFGLIMIASAGAVYADIRYEDAYFFLKRQSIGLCLGLVALFFFAWFDYRRLKSLASIGFIVSLGFLVALLIPGLGTDAYGATRWINLGPVSFQPSEMAKLAMIVYLSAWLSARGARNVSNVTEGLFPFLVVVGILGVLLLAQPDMGTLLIILAIAGVMFFSAGGHFGHILGSAGLGGVLIFLLIRSSEYRWNRLLVFLNPEMDPQGRGYQIKQALIALGSGGVFGLGLGNSHQKFNYLPEPATDSIFAIVGEELGLIGALTVVLMFLVFAIRGYRVASRAEDQFGRLLAIGITSWIVFQAFLNMGAISGLVPLTGIPLPLISYGGSSMVFTLAGLGILLSVSRYSRR